MSSSQVIEFGHLSIRFSKQNDEQDRSRIETLWEEMPQFRYPPPTLHPDLTVPPSHQKPTPVFQYKLPSLWSCKWRLCCCDRSLPPPPASDLAACYRVSALPFFRGSQSDPWLPIPFRWSRSKGTIPWVPSPYLYDSRSLPLSSGSPI